MDRSRRGADKPTPGEVRRRVRSLDTPQLLLIAAAFGGDIALENAPPRESIARLDAMRTEAIAELARRGIAVEHDCDMVTVMTYRG